MAMRKVPIPVVILGFLLAISIILIFIDLPEIELPQLNFRDPFILFAFMFVVFVLGGAIYDRARKR